MPKAVKVTRTSAAALEFDRILGRLAEMTGTTRPGFLHREGGAKGALARYYPPSYYQDYPQGLVVLYAQDRPGLEERACHEFQHHLDQLAGVYCDNPRGRHDDAFYERTRGLHSRYRAYRAATFVTPS